MRDRKKQMVSGGAPACEATLQQGLPLPAERGAADQFWTFTMSNSQASSFAKTSGFDATLRMHVIFTRTALCVLRLSLSENRCPLFRDMRYAPRVTFVAHTPTSASVGGRRACDCGKNLFRENNFGPSGPSCLKAEGFWPAAG
jgi:hypothetical protein